MRDSGISLDSDVVLFAVGVVAAVVAGLAAFVVVAVCHAVDAAQHYAACAARD